VPQHLKGGVHKNKHANEHFNVHDSPIDLWII